jgi:hypothetical protein
LGSRAVAATTALVEETSGAPVEPSSLVPPPCVAALPRPLASLRSCSPELRSPRPAPSAPPCSPGDRPRSCGVVRRWI